LLLKVKRDVSLERFLSCLEVDDFLFFVKCLVLAALAVGHVLIKDDLVSFLHRLILTQSSDLTTFSKFFNLCLLVPQQGITHRLGQILANRRLDILHWVDSFEELLVGHVSLIVLLELNGSPECL